SNSVRFDSREATTAANRPKLSIDFTFNDVDPPTATLLDPLDNGPADENATAGEVRVGLRDTFVIGLDDYALDDASVTAEALSVTKDAAPFTDYTFSFDAAADQITLTPTAGSFDAGLYTITLSSGDSKIADQTGNPMPPTALVLDLDASLPTTPVAADDTYQTDEDTPLIADPEAGVLDNDFGGNAPGDAVLLTGPSNGTLVLNPDGSFTYTPADDFTGQDSFTYTLVTPLFTSNLATATINVSAQSPVAVDDIYETSPGTAIVVDAAEGVLANDREPQGEVMTAVLLSDPQNGTLSFNPDGSFTYTPKAGFAGSDLFTYQAVDPSGLSATATVTIVMPGVVDWGDAPSPYPTLSADDGPVHNATGPTLGSNRDNESDGQPSDAADGDGADEDGVTFGSIRVGQLDASVSVNVQNAPAGAKLDAWIDFNGDGNWGGPGEQIFDAAPVSNGDNALQFDVPSWAASGNTFARFRLSTKGDLGVSGSAADGEVEDYRVTIIPPAESSNVYLGQNIISTAANGPTSLFAADVDGDGDIDVLSASQFDDTIAWYENDGSGRFVAHTISTAADFAIRVFAADVDGDGDMDVLSASVFDNKIVWYENDGDQRFTPHLITTLAFWAVDVIVADMDGDGDIDVLSASRDDDKIAWYENDGNQQFTAHTISTAANGARRLFAADVDGDGDIDVLSASRTGDQIDWYENDGSQRFTPHNISSTADGAMSVIAADLDGDGDMDVLSASYNDDKIVWYENDGGENFTPHTISANADNVQSVSVADMDGDGDLDVLSASYNDDKIAWYENDGSGGFTPHTISTDVDGARSAIAADVDGDGDLDVFSASTGDNTIAWYENDGNPSLSAAADSYTSGEDELLSVPAASGVLANDSDTQGGSLSAVLEVDAQHGNLVLAADGSFTYLPEENFFGTDSFSYRATVDSRRSVPALVQITVESVNDAPTAVDDEYEVDEDTLLVSTKALAPSDGLMHHWTFDETSGEVLSDVAGQLDGTLVNWDASEDTWVEGVVGGALDMGDNNNYVELSDVIASRDTYTISVWTRLDQTGTLNPRIFGWLLQNTEIAGGVGIYFEYQSGEAYAPSNPVVGQWEHYALTLNRISGDAIVYRDGVAVGTGTFRRGPPVNPWLIGHHVNPDVHSASWHGLLDDVRVYDRILSPQEVQAMHLAVTGGNRVGVLLNDSDADGDALSAAVVDEPGHGKLAFNVDGTFTYEPEAEFYGTDSFTYRIDDGTTESNVATVTITVRPVNDVPVAVDDSFSVPTTGALVVDVAAGLLANDSDVEGDELTMQVVSDPQHGTLQWASDGSFEYTPGPTFDQTDSFTYRASDGQGLSEIATVTIVVGTKIVDVALVAVAQPSSEDTLGELPASLSEVAAGTSYFVEVWVQDIDEPSLGISGGTVDLGYNTAPADVTALSHGSLFNFLTTGEIDDPTGLVDDFGGGTFEAGVGIAPTWARLGYVEVLATAAGPVTFTLSEGRSAFGRSGLGNVPWDKVDLSSTLTVEQVGGLVQFDMTVVRQPTNVDALGQTKTLPKDAEFLHEWESFWVEVWVSTPDDDGIGIAGGTLDLVYDTTRFTATQIKHGAAFSDQTTGTIDDAAGLIRNLGALTTRGGIGDADHALLARVRFEPTAADEAEVDVAGQSIGPYDLGLGLSNLQFPGVETRISPAPETPVWAVFYDVDDSGLIDLGDFSRFAPAFGQTVDGAEPIVWWADFDKSGLVDFGDFSFFVANVNRSKPDAFVSFPENYPEAWLPDPRADTPGAAAGTPIRVELVAVPTPRDVERVAELPETMREVASGQTFYIEVWLRDLFNDAKGITGGMVDLLFDSTKASAIDVQNSDQFGVFSDGVIKAADGLIDRLGGGTFSAGLGVEDEWARLATIEYIATTDGQIRFSLGEGDLQLSRFNLGNVSWDDVELGSLTLNASPISPADLTGNGFVDFQDLTILLANWNQDVSAAEGNLVDEDGTPVNFQDLTVLLAAWTGPGPAASPPAAVRSDRLQPVESDRMNPVTTSTSGRQAAREDIGSTVSLKHDTSAVMLKHNLRAERRGDVGFRPAGGTDGRLQAAAVDRAMGEGFALEREMIVGRRARRAGRR
ncbi:MAG: tandem-95 repeat protein, partial [Planctomycetes bacterium]|nr:tandem-95 repeat protein [Planctomycetota bacterium]